MPDKRYRELDALRGLASAIVVLDHFSSIWLWQAHPGWNWWLFVSPLRVFTDGHAAVILFFLLSGFVLTLPYLRPHPPRYGAFLIKRVFRIYFPYLAALALAVAGAALFRGPVYGFAPWVEGIWRQPVDLTLVMQHVAFLGNYDYQQFNGAFWTLIQEMRVSVLFPAIVLLAIATRARTSLGAAAALSFGAQVLAGTWGHWEWFRSLHYAAIFLLGGAMASNIESLSGWYARLDNTGRAGLAVASSLLFLYSGEVERLAFTHGRFEDWAAALGAAGLVILSLHSLALARFLRNGAMQKLGAVSFSTYLVHVPILLALVHGLAGTSWATMFLLYLVLTGVASVVFHKLIEEPARYAGKRLAERMGGRTAQAGG